jgi:antirestriction protein ArdC
MVVYAGQVQRDTDDASADDSDGKAPSHTFTFLKHYTVFNAEQCDGLPEEFYATRQIAVRDNGPIPEADAVIRQSGARIRTGERPAYSPTLDLIEMPPIGAFISSERYYSTCMHEIVHWTGAPGRLDRDLSGRFGSESYAMEELVAELGAAYLCAALGISAEPREDHASYLANWLRVLKSDKRAIFSACAKAQQAADFLMGVKRERE